MPDVTVTTEFLNEVVSLAKAAGSLDKVAQAQREAAPRVIDVMISNGLVNPAKRDEFVQKMAGDPLCVYRTLEKVAASVSARSMGKGEEEARQEPGRKVSAADKFFEDAFLGRR